GLIGLFVMVFIINLRLDALLYARTVNGLRNKFCNDSGLTIAEELPFRVLPLSIHQPRYFEWHYTIVVIAVFALIDTAYLFLGWYWYYSDGYANVEIILG